MALTRDEPRRFETSSFSAALASTTIYQGACVGIVRASGQAAGGAFDGSTHRFAGFATTRAAIGERVTIDTKGRVILAVAGTSAASVNAVVYASDDNSFNISGSGIPIGRISWVQDDGKCVVDFDAGFEASAPGIATTHSGGVAIADPITGLPIPHVNLLVSASKPVLLVGAGTFNSSGLLTLTNTMNAGWTYPFAAQVYLAASNGLAGGIYDCTINSTSAIQLAAPNNVTTAGAYASTTAEAILSAVTMPGGALGNFGRLQIRHVWSMQSSANVKTMRVKLSTEDLAYIQNTATVGFNGQTDIWNGGAENTQWKRNQGAGSQNFGNMTGVPTTTSVDTSVDSVIYFTGQLANTSDYLVLHMRSAEAYYLNV